MDLEGHSAGIPPSLSDAMDKIMAHPELISMVASVLGTPDGQRREDAEEDGTRNTGEDAEGARSSTAHREPAELMASLTPILSSLRGVGEKEANDDRSRLLRALKPYVSQSRREAIDTMIRISQVSDLLKRLS